ncbi:Txe/YoeB family addiction module toxin [Rhizobium rhizogenes]|uniref:Txe/YoeB family addiction module toxin n=1 Tax=Rhizobium rhizogenes TaxID=359 RepID=UPI001574C2C7|nr:Txe/YoeB family addiction module toxin [Rhizobium rhizogenes]NTF42785.1 Txe/YoeB family addiction module toxin [Rhizobium rhizogenes]
MLLAWHAHAWEDYLYWQEKDRKIAIRINELLRDALRHPFEGLGKPEPLRNQLKGQWSRRITQEHRLIYRVEGEGERQTLIVLQCRFHY